MVYQQKQMIESKAMQEKYFKTELEYIPNTLFVNKKFLGSLGRISNTLVINLVNIDNLNSPIIKTFLPTHYMSNPSLKYLDCDIDLEAV